MSRGSIVITWSHCRVGEYPALAASITKALHDIAHVSAPSTAGMTEVT